MTFHRLANLHDLHDGYLAPFRIHNRSILLIQEGGKHYVIENRCPHMDAPLSTGSLKNGHIVCRSHGIAFDLGNGQALGPLSGILPCLTFFEVAYEGSQVGVNMDF